MKTTLYNGALEPIAIIDLAQTVVDLLTARDRLDLAILPDISPAQPALDDVMRTITVKPIHIQWRGVKKMYLILAEQSFDDDFFDTTLSSNHSLLCSVGKLGRVLWYA